jgi:dihydroflavonol-4-reductase
MEFLSINPAAVLGPVWARDFSASIEMVNQLLSGALPGCPDLGFGIVDVRDLADLHVRALTEPGLDGERFIASGPFLKMADVAAILRSAMPLEARKVPTRRLPDWIVRFAAKFNPLIRQVVGELGNVRDAQRRPRARAARLEDPRPAEQSIVDCAKSLIEQGIVKVYRIRSRRTTGNRGDLPSSRHRRHEGRRVRRPLPRACDVLRLLVAQLPLDPAGAAARHGRW